MKLHEIITYESAVTPASKKAVYTYNNMGLKDTFTTPEGYKEKYEYDKNGLLIRTRKYDNDGTEKSVSRIAYDSKGNKIKEVSPKYYKPYLDNSNDYTYDSSNSDTSFYYTYSYNDKGQLISSTDPENNITGYTYDFYGNKQTETKPNGNIYKYEYDFVNRPTKTYFKENVNIANWTLLNEKIYSVLSANQDYPYKRHQVVDKSYINDASYTTPVTNTSIYDYSGRTLEQWTNSYPHTISKYNKNGTLYSVTDPKQNTITYKYDYLKLLTETNVPYVKNGVTYNSISTNEYYKNGLKKRDKVTKNKPEDTTTYRETSFSYNTRGLLNKVTQSDGANSYYTQFYYDYDGRKLRMYTGLTTPLTINGLDNVTPGTDITYSITKYSYNYLGKLTKITYPLNWEDNYTQYDLNGNLIKETDRNNNLINYDYDKLDRIKTKSVKCSMVSNNMYYTYTYNNMGNRSAISGGSTTTKYDYDNSGRLSKETLSNGVVKDYTYIGTTSNRESFKISIDNVVKEFNHYSYDDCIRLYRVKDANNQTIIATYTYDYNGNRDTLTYDQIGKKIKYWYTFGNKLEKLINYSDINMTTEISKYEYTYYLDGNQESKKASIPNSPVKTSDYVYDGLGRLKSEVEKDNGSPVFGKSYTYDDLGNRDIMSVTGNEVYSVDYNYDAMNKLVNEIKTIGGTTETTSYTYDNNGNQQTKLVNGTTVFTNTYNGFNQLRRVSQNGITTNYAYDADDLRIYKDDGSTRIIHIWNGSNIALEIDSYKNVLNKYVWGVNQIYTEDGSGANRKYYLFNGHGDVVQLIGNTGSVLKCYNYDAFGIDKNPESNDTNVYRYCGEYFDKETGSIYLRARYYDPTIGRFITEDSVRGRDKDPLSLNLYTYCHNDPINYWDPSGNTEGSYYANKYYSEYEQNTAKSTPSPKIKPAPKPEATPDLPYDEWNNTKVRNSTNCYAYAINMKCFPDGKSFYTFKKFLWIKIEGGGIDPGEIAIETGYYLKFRPIENPYLKSDKSNMTQVLKLDAEATERNMVELNSKDSPIPNGTYRIAVAYSDKDYHFYRQDANGSWSSKPGSSPIRWEGYGPDFTRDGKYPSVKFYAIEKN